MVAMATDANPLDDPLDAAALVAYAAALVAAVEIALPVWVEQMVVQRWHAWSAVPPATALLEAARVAAQAARAEVDASLRALLVSDVGDQRTNPLSILRQAARYPSGVLAAAGVPPVVRDAQAERLFPEDLYDLGPAAFADLGATVHEAGLVWGAAKAHVVLARRRSPSA